MEKRADIQRIAIVGPESTGKSTLAAALAAHFRTKWVKEYARSYLTHLKNPYVLDDLVHIARGQLALEEDTSKEADRLLICDTNLLVIDVWSRYVFGKPIPEVTEHLIRHYNYALTLLTNIDVPWTPDPLREHPNARTVLFDLYVERLHDLHIPYVCITGTLHEGRVQQAVEAIMLCMSPG